MAGADQVEQLVSELDTNTEELVEQFESLQTTSEGLSQALDELEETESAAIDGVTSKWAELGEAIGKLAATAKSETTQVSESVQQALASIGEASQAIDALRSGSSSKATALAGALGSSTGALEGAPPAVEALAEAVEQGHEALATSASDAAETMMERLQNTASKDKSLLQANIRKLTRRCEEATNTEERLSQFFTDGHESRLETAASELETNIGQLAELLNETYSTAGEHLSTALDESESDFAKGKDASLEECATASEEAGQKVTELIAELGDASEAATDDSAALDSAASELNGELRGNSDTLQRLTAAFTEVLRNYEGSA